MLIKRINRHFKEREKEKKYLKWLNLFHQLNVNTFLTPPPFFDLKRLNVGKYTYGEFKVNDPGNSGIVRIGCFCSIASSLFMLASQHYTNRISTYPFKAMIIGNTKEAFTKGDIIIEDDVWIGLNATIMGGVKIGKGAIVGACSVVTKDVPPYSIVVGNPAKIVKKRFSDDIIEKLMKIDFNSLDTSKIKNNIEVLYQEITKSNIDDVIEKFI